MNYDSIFRFVIDDINVQKSRHGSLEKILDFFDFDPLNLTIRTIGWEIPNSQGTAYPIRPFKLEPFSSLEDYVREMANLDFESYESDETCEAQFESFGMFEDLSGNETIEIQKKPSNFEIDDYDAKPVERKFELIVVASLIERWIVAFHLQSSKQFFF